VGRRHGARVKIRHRGITRQSSRSEK